MANNQNATNNNQNQQQGSLLNRVANNKNANNNQNQLTNNNTNNNNNNPPRSRFGNGNRFGNNKQQSTKPTWTITPMRDAGIKVAFQGIGDPLFRILGKSLDISLSDVKILVERLEGDDDLCQQLIDKLDEAWEVYDFHEIGRAHV